jgi:RNA polymerase sigma-70 factor, ECF subfamily
MIDACSPVLLLDDKEIVQRIIHGQKDEFEILVERYNRKLFVYLCRLLNFNQNDAQDVLQEMWLNAYVNLVTFNPRLSFSSWLYRIAHNLAVDLIRKKYKHFIVDTNNEETQAKIYNNQTVITKGEEEMEIAINKNRLDSVLTKLDLDNRNLLVMFYLQGLSLIEISDILKITVNTLSVRLKRARVKAQSIISNLNL